jgi:pyridoxal/pyridoxine/pyridoxamine kinase
VNNYIIWVDDKPYEGGLIYHKLISQFHYPTVLFQLRSTRDLEAWIKDRRVIIEDETKKMIMITNMVRNENGQRNFYAGIDAINIVNQFIQPNIPVALYVGDLKSA